MKLHGQEFGWAFCASGARNIDGSGYSYHRWLKWCGLRYRKSTLITKTVTIAPTVGNMPLKEDGITPQERVPPCIYADHWQGITLNAVALSNRGLDFYLDTKTWHDWPAPFVISFMAIGNTLTDRLNEDQQFVQRLRCAAPKFRSAVAVERNYSCPNVGHNLTEFVGDIRQSLDILAELDRPIIVKLNALVSTGVGAEISQHPACSAICISNTIPFLKLEHRINWKQFFPDLISPLTKRGFKQEGGLGGKPLLPIVCDWIKASRYQGLAKPAIACGGILSRADVKKVVAAGASALEVGSASILRPWAVQGIIRTANRLFPIATK